MSYIDNLGDELKMNLKDWPHMFTKTGKTFQIGVDEDETPMFAVEMTCTYCHVRYVNGQQSRPSGFCPARSKKSETKRLLS